MYGNQGEIGLRERQDRMPGGMKIQTRSKSFVSFDFI